MRITLSAIKEFWKLPEGKQFLSGCFLAIGVLCSIIAYDHLHTIPTLTNDKLRLTQECGRMRYEMQKECDSEKARINKEFEQWKFDFINTRYTRLEARERAADSANQVTYRIMQINQKALNK